MDGRRKDEQVLSNAKLSLNFKAPSIDIVTILLYKDVLNRCHQSVHLIA
jgi:hypothetical protein